MVLSNHTLNKDVHAMLYKLLFLIQLSLFCALIQCKELPLQHGINAIQNYQVSDYWVSEKLDGIRGYWDGKQLYTRQGNLINAPKWFTQDWPMTPLEGELWSKRSDFQNIVSCIQRKTIKAHCWKKLTLMVFDLPKNIGNFSERIMAMNELLSTVPSPYLKPVRQQRVSTQDDLYKWLDKVVLGQGEGLMLHHQDSFYKTGRNKSLMKLKKYMDAEAIVIKHITGKGKYKTMLGSILVVTDSGIQFKIGSGFSDQQRKHPPPIGSTITYKFIGKTQRGVPRFASFIRIRK